MDITFTDMFSGFRVANFLKTPIGMKHPVDVKCFICGELYGHENWHQPEHKKSLTEKMISPNTLIAFFR
jgi:hypothetical protein